MSGGHFNYKQYHIGEIAEKIQSIVDNNGRKKTEQELKDEQWWVYNEPDYYKKYPDELYITKHSDEIIEKFKEAVNILRKAEVYAQRIDWYLSGDDGDETFIKRLKEDLEKL